MSMGFDADKVQKLNKEEKKALDELLKEPIKGFYVGLPESLYNKLDEFLYKKRFTKKDWLEAIIQNIDC